MPTNDILSTLWIEIDDAIEELRALHVNSSDFTFNPTAYMFTKQAGDHMMCCCPVHPESSPSFGIEMIPPYRCQCFSCGYQGNLPLLYAHELDKGLNYLVGLKYILKTFAVSTESRPKFDLDAVLTRGINGKRVRDEDELQNYTMTEESDGYKYWTRRRRFTKRAIDTYELGYDESVASVTMPVRDLHGNLRFIKRRSIHQKEFRNEEAIYKRDILYGLHLIKKAGVTRVKMVESETDAIACYCARLPAVALMGRILFDEQVKMLQRANVQVVDLLLDNDEKGIEATDECYDKLKKNFRVNVGQYPPTVDAKDSNDLLKLGLLQHIEFVPKFFA